MKRHYSVCVFVLSTLFLGELTFAASAKPSPLPAKATSKSAPTAQADSKRVPLNTHGSVRIILAMPAWNSDARSFDSGSILMRDSASGRIVQIHLEETAPDSGVFSGVYSINWKNLERVEVEFYVPPQNQLNSKDGLKSLTAMIERHELKRKPFVLHRNETGQQMVDIFETADQAREALKRFRAEQKLVTMPKAGKVAKSPADEVADSLKMAAEMKAKQESAENSVLRAQLQAAETKHIADLKAAQSKLSPADIAKQVALAAQVAGEATPLIIAGKLPEARAKYEQARDLDPGSGAIYYQYATTFYRMDKFNEALAMYSFANGPAVNPVEKTYFMGLSYYRLKEYTNAVSNFDSVIASKDKVMAPSSMFYKGIALYEQKTWDEAQKAFQAVMDSSEDPALDKQAETYVELILRARQFEAEQAKKWTVSATFGEMYDSNVLTIADTSDIGTASNAAGYRSLLTGTVKYRPIYEDTHEFAAQLDVVDMYTVDSSLNTKQSLTNADPTMFTLTLPYTKKGIWLGTGYRLNIIPGYQSIFMSVEDNTNKDILDAYTLSISNMFVMTDRWFATYSLDMEQDNSRLNSSTGVNDSTGLKVKGGTSHLLIVSDDKSKMLIPSLSYTLNQAKGSDITYDRIDTGATYMQPFKWETSASLTLGYYLLHYLTNANGRTDNSYSITTGLTRKLTDTWTSGVTIAYNINNSNVAANQYTKWTAMITASSSWGL